MLKRTNMLRGVVLGAVVGLVMVLIVGCGDPVKESFEAACNKDLACGLISAGELQECIDVGEAFSDLLSNPEVFADALDICVARRDCADYQACIEALFGQAVTE